MALSVFVLRTARTALVCAFFSVLIRSPLFSQSVRMATVGDFFPSPSLIASGQLKDGTRDYFPTLEPVHPYLSNTHFAICWFGGPVAAPGENFTGYPTYNNPPDFPRSVRRAGFNIFLHTNHLFDQGIQGLLRSVRFFRDNGIRMLGMYDSPEARAESLSASSFFVANGMKIAVLSYLYGSNVYLKHPKWMANYIETNLIREDIEAVRANGADFVIVALHWGTEYERLPEPWQTNAARNFAYWGADMILGSHPHVLQPADLISVKRADGRERKVFVIYSCGNFMHTMRGQYKDGGLILRYTLERDFWTRDVKLKKISYVPTWLYWGVKKEGGYRIRVLPAREYLDRYEKGERGFLSQKDYEMMKQSWNDTIAHMDNPKIGFVHER